MRFLREVNIAVISEISNNLAKKTGFIIVISWKRVKLPEQSALVAQRIEQLPSKQWVVGSIPARGATLFLFPPKKSPRPEFLFPLFGAELQGFM